jgi:HlyD family secretion protein
MRRAWLVCAAVGVVVAGYLLLDWARSGNGRPRFVTAAVDHGPISAVVTATGTVNPVATVQVGTYVSGTVAAILADFNTPVHRGQLLAKIDARPFQVKVDAARADLANAKARLQKDNADLTLKTVSLKRMRELAAGGIASQSDLDLAVSQEQQARAQISLDAADIQSAEARTREAEVNLAYTDIASPVDGVVVSRSVDVGQTVAATFQTPTLFLVAGDLAKMMVSASVSESDIGHIAVGQEARFTVDAYPGNNFEGKVAEVRNAPVTVQNVVTYDVILHVDNKELRLKPGMTANVTITTASRPDALRVANSALRFRPPADLGGAGARAAEAERGGPRVWVLDHDDHPRPVALETGIADDRFTEVTGGLSEGQRVIVAMQRQAAPTVEGRPPGFMPGGGGRRGH